MNLKSLQGQRVEGGILCKITSASNMSYVPPLLTENSAHCKNLKIKFKQLLLQLLLCPDLLLQFWM